MDRLHVSLEKYGVSRKTGFVPDAGSQPLPTPLSAWEDFATRLSTHLKAKESFVETVHKLPPFDVQELRSEADWQRAYIVLSFTVHAYCHGCDQTVIPFILAGPYSAVCEHLGMKTVVSYAGLCLFNWAPGENQAIGGLQAQMSFTGTIDEAAFYLTPVLVDQIGGGLVATFLQALRDAAEGEWANVSQALDTCSENLTGMTDVLGELRHCRPDYFYNVIRPHFDGMKVHFEDKNGEQYRVDVAGASAAQNPLFQFIDHILAVKHKTLMLKEMREYMPSCQRRFLELVDELPSLAELARQRSAPDEIWAKIDLCRTKLKSWRDKHVAIVTRYVMLPAQAAARKKGVDATAVTGTAGSSPIQFLKEIRNETMPTVGGG